MNQEQISPLFIMQDTSRSILLWDSGEPQVNMRVTVGGFVFKVW